MIARRLLGALLVSAPSVFMFAVVAYEKGPWAAVGLFGFAAAIFAAIIVGTWLLDD